MPVTKSYLHLVFSISLVMMLCQSVVAQDESLSGELKKWHKVTISFEGPPTEEAADSNPFLDFRLNVKFTNGDTQYTVPGYFAADGNAGQSGASKGNIWKVHFSPDKEGVWTYVVSFVKGDKVAINPDPDAGQEVAFNGAEGRFTIQPTDKSGKDFRAKGRLNYVGEHYLQFAETGEYYLKGGADSPENFLAYYEFDQTYKIMKEEPQRQGEAKSGPLHHYEPHAKDWQSGDPTWQGGKGKNIIGALNYLASEEMNNVYFLTMNVGGDGKDVWPWIGPKERKRFDCSKLDQWEIVFSHMDRLGLLMHVITQEQENDQLLDGGELGVERKLYYRELIARFAHHPALVWNLGEENTNTTEQRKAFVDYIKATDPYDHPIVVHTFPGRYDEVYSPLLGYDGFEGPSLQMGNMSKTHEETKKWVNRSAEEGHKWFVCLDEIGPANTGVKPDKDDFWHDQVRKEALWGNLMAGGSGCEWYFGYKFAHNDLNCEDWRSRENMWNLTRYALEFFHQHLPFHEMVNQNELTADTDDYCFVLPREVYAIYLPNGGTTVIDLPRGNYSIKWYNPRRGGDLQEGSLIQAVGPGEQSIGDPPGEKDSDWVVLLKRK